MSGNSRNIHRTQMLVPTAESIKVVDPNLRKDGIYSLRIVGRLPPPARVVVKKSRGRPRRPRQRRAPTPNFQSESTLAYVRAVRRTFYDRPEVYQEFVAIMGEINRPGANMLELINRVVVLFDGYPDLLYSFDAFLPPEYELEQQDDAVVIKVYEEEGGVYPGGAGAAPVSSSASRPGTAKPTIDETVEYVKGVKKTFAFRPEVYRDFSLLLQAFRTKTASELEVIRAIVKLFHSHPNLVLGFNEFLPSGFSIKMYDSRKYTIDYLDHDGSPVTTTISC